MKIAKDIIIEFGEYEVGLWLKENIADCPRTAKMDEITRVLLFKLSTAELQILAERLNESVARNKENELKNKRRLISSTMLNSKVGL